MQPLALKTNALRISLFGAGTLTVFTREQHMISFLMC